jgi:hypothetical protein
VAPALNARHLAGRIFMHAARMLWSGLGRSVGRVGFTSSRYWALCRNLQGNFGEFLFHTLG